MHEVNASSRRNPGRVGHAGPLPVATLALAALGLLGNSGCTWLSYLGTTQYGSPVGRVYFVGGVGSIGQVAGTTSVPKGLRQARYRGSTEVFAWQSVVGGTLRDQMDRNRNEDQGRRLAQRIQDYLAEYPEGRVDIVALSAGTGVVVWALESLPENCRVGTVVFLGSSLSRRYDLTEAISHVDGHLHNFYSTRDPVLRFGLPITGSVDRAPRSADAAGMYGFMLPAHAGESTRQLYRRHLRNRPYRTEYRRYGYYGLHADATQRKFIARVVAPLVMEDLALPRDILDYPAPPPIRSAAEKWTHIH